MKFTSLYNALINDLDLDTDDGQRTRHYRICGAVILMGYGAWDAFVRFFPTLVKDVAEFRYINSAIALATLLASYHYPYVRKHLEKIVFFNLLSVLAHCIAITQIDHDSPGVWVTSYMGFACSAILIRNPRLLTLFLAAGFFGFSAANTLGESSEIINYFLISTLILGITLLSTVHEDVWSLLTLNEKNRKITEMNRQQTFVIEQLSHDLKTPLVPLVGLLPDLKVADDMSARKLKMCIQSADHLTYCIRQIASYAAVANAQQLHPKKETDLTELTQHTLLRVLNFTNGEMTRARLINTGPVLAPVDLFLYEQLVTNLLTNALKFSNENSQIEVRVQYEKNRMCLRVKDHGIGMTPEEARRVFEPFYCADSARSKKNSTGLGLTICKRIVEIHSGTIEIEATAPGQGTTMKVTLPTTTQEQLPLSKEA